MGQNASSVLYETETRRYETGTGEEAEKRKNMEQQQGLGSEQEFPFYLLSGTGGSIEKGGQSIPFLLLPPYFIRVCIHSLIFGVLPRFMIPSFPFSFLPLNSCSILFPKGAVMYGPCERERIKEKAE